MRFRVAWKGVSMGSDGSFYRVKMFGSLNENIVFLQGHFVNGDCIEGEVCFNEDNEKVVVISGDLNKHQIPFSLL